MTPPESRSYALNELRACDFLRAYQRIIDSAPDKDPDCDESVLVRALKEVRSIELSVDTAIHVLGMHDAQE